MKKTLKYIRYAGFAFAWIVVNLFVLYPVTTPFFPTIALIITIGNLLWSVLIPFVWRYLKIAHFKKMPKYIRFVNKHLLGIFGLVIISGIVLLVAYNLHCLSVFIEIFPIQLLLWGLMYVYNVAISRNNTCECQESAGNIGNEIMEKKKERIDSIAVKNGKKLHFIPISEIVCFQAYGDYVNLMTLQGTYLKEQTLKYFEEHLPEDLFLRVHRSNIVNLRAIKTIESYGRAQYLLRLSNNETVKATPEGYRKLKEVLHL